MSCLTFAEAQTIVEDIVKKYHPNDYKMFIAKREGIGIIRKTQLSLVVKPNDTLNAQMYEELMQLQDNSSTDCIKVLYSQVDIRDTRMIDLFLLEIETEIA